MAGFPFGFAHFVVTQWNQGERAGEKGREMAPHLPEMLPLHCVRGSSMTDGGKGEGVRITCNPSSSRYIMFQVFYFFQSVIAEAR
ncbi:MAG: hypothetical protein A2Z15_07350 [Chloroflexi bacterium RBG_16_50_11]|nr:MAG: hypothetical protein A2Z15_07350 [Chloroflexi bacterium RBG_16_50_11]